MVTEIESARKWLVQEDYWQFLHWQQNTVCRN